jgi:NADH-quinone oxidoreductase subunit C
MALDHPAAARLKTRFPGLALKGASLSGQSQIWIPREHLAEIVLFLRDDPTLRYDMLCDISCVDYLNFPGWDKPRFGLVYVFNSVAGGNPRLILRVFLAENELEVDSLTPLFAGAEWLEREVFDMFGVRFTGHPDLRRILTWDGFSAHPLRKDYPVIGRGERENYPVISRDSA